MADRSEKDNQNTSEPDGLGEHARGPSSEAAHEQGWDINEEERTKQPEGRPAYYGGKGFDYGAADFGDTPRPTEDTEREESGTTPPLIPKDKDRKAS